MYLHVYVLYMYLQKCIQCTVYYVPLAAEKPKLGDLIPIPLSWQQSRALGHFLKLPVSTVSVKVCAVWYGYGTVLVR